VLKFDFPLSMVRWREGTISFEIFDLDICGANFEGI
jgi:hypothetical protein